MVDLDAGALDQREQRRNVRVVHVAEARAYESDPVVFVAEVVDGDPLLRRDVRDRPVSIARRSVVVEDVVVLDVRAHRERCRRVAAVEEDGRAGDALQRGPIA